MINEMIRKVTEQVMQRRDEEILDALGRLGYKFTTKKELHQFCANHLEVKKTGNVSVLELDGEPVAQWSEKITTSIEGRTINIKIG